MCMCLFRHSLNQTILSDWSILPQGSIEPKINFLLIRSDSNLQCLQRLSTLNSCINMAVFIYQDIDDLLFIGRMQW